MGTKFHGIQTVAQYRRGELARDILRLVGAGIMVGGLSVIAPNTLQLIEYLQPDGRLERNRIWKALRYLEEKNRIRVEERGNVAYLVLTHEGRIRLDEQAIWDLAVDTPRRWDKKWRLVMFDLPATRNRVRQSFRLKLEDLGLQMYQRSVFIFPHDCQKEIRAIAHWYGVDDYVRYVVAEEIKDGRHFAKKFDLL